MVRLTLANQMHLSRGDGFNGFATPDPSNQIDDDQVAAGEPNTLEQDSEQHRFCACEL